MKLWLKNDTITEEEVETYDIDDDVNALLGGEELSEEFKVKAKTIFRDFHSRQRLLK